MSSSFSYLVVFSVFGTWVLCSASEVVLPLVCRQADSVPPAENVNCLSNQDKHLFCIIPC